MNIFSWELELHNQEQCLTMLMELLIGYPNGKLEENKGGMDHI